MHNKPGNKLMRENEKIKRIPRKQENVMLSQEKSHIEKTNITMLGTKIHYLILIKKYCNKDRYKTKETLTFDDHFCN